MKAVTADEFCQNLTATLDDVQNGDTYIVTRHGHAIARVVPVELQTAATIDELVEWAKGDR